MHDMRDSRLVRDSCIAGLASYCVSNDSGLLCTFLYSPSVLEPASRVAYMYTTPLAWPRPSRQEYSPAFPSLSVRVLPPQVARHVRYEPPASSLELPSSLQNGEDTPICPSEARLMSTVGFARSALAVRRTVTTTKQINQVEEEGCRKARGTVRALK